MQKYVILYAVVNLNHIEKENILSNIKESLIYRKLHQGSYKYSCGSLFKNDKNYKAYELIKKVKLSDLKINEIHFSNKHCNILVNDENGGCYDVILLVKLIKETIKKQLDINLKEELIIY